MSYNFQLLWKGESTKWLKKIYKITRNMTSDSSFAENSCRSVTTVCREENS
jgi:hypothetical protein